VAAKRSASTAPIRVSVCICTRNRPQDLRCALESVARSTTAVAEVIVSDDSTDDQARQLVETEYPNVRWQRGPRRGLGPNRNAAIVSATGSHVLFLDDDAQLGEQFISTCAAAIELHAPPTRERIIVTGVECQPDGRRVSAHEQDYLGFQRVAYTSRDQIHTVVINSTLFPRELFEQHDFDEQLVYGYDEVDLASRAVAAGFRIQHEEQAVNLHSPSDVNRSYYRPHVESSRLYVTAKRRGVTEGKPFAAATYLTLAVAHLAASSLRPGARLRPRDLPLTAFRALRMLARHVRAQRS
jgi:glycosyltransferase involved in cell wall biosynthesis